MKLATNLEVDVVQNVEEFIGPLLDLSQVDDHVVDVDWHVEAEHVLERLLRASEPLERLEDERL